MDLQSSYAVLIAVLVSSCSSADFSVQAGFTHVSVGGDVALANNSGGLANATRQDIEPGFGLGDAQGSPFLRVQADFGGPVLTASGFVFREHGEGVLAATFGGLDQATAVTSELDFGCAKLSATYDVDIGPVTVSPGLAIDVIDFDFRASDLLGNSEVIDEVVALPLLFLRAGASLGTFSVVAEAGYLETPRIDAAKGRFLDLEGMLGWSPLPRATLFAGYRHVGIDVIGDTGTESFALDLRISGWLVGGGIGF